jgi:hypothetical protein
MNILKFINIGIFAMTYGYQSGVAGLIPTAILSGNGIVKKRIKLR